MKRWQQTLQQTCLITVESGQNTNTLHPAGIQVTPFPSFHLPVLEEALKFTALALMSDLLLLITVLNIEKFS